MFEKSIINAALRDRMLILTTMATVMLALVIIVVAILNIRPSDIQLPVRYSDYSDVILYRNKWYYLLSFIGFGLSILILQPLITLKLLQEKGRSVAVAFSSIGIMVALIGLLFTLAVFRVVSISL